MGASECGNESLGFHKMWEILNSCGPVCFSGRSLLLGGRERERWREEERDRERQRTKGIHAIILKSMRHGEKHIRSFCKKKPLLQFIVEKNNIRKSEIFQLQVLCWTKINYENCISLG